MCILHIKHVHYTYLDKTQTKFILKCIKWKEKIFVKKKKNYKIDSKYNTSHIVSFITLIFILVRVCYYIVIYLKYFGSMNIAYLYNIIIMCIIYNMKITIQLSWSVGYPQAWKTHRDDMRCHDKEFRILIRLYYTVRAWAYILSGWGGRCIWRQMRILCTL